MVKNLPETWKTWVQSLDQEDPLKKEMATHSSILGLPWWPEGVSLEKGMDTHSSILAWRIPWTEEPDRLWSMVLQRVGHN